MYTKKIRYGILFFLTSLFIIDCGVLFFKKPENKLKNLLPFALLGNLFQSNGQFRLNSQITSLNEGESTNLSLSFTGKATSVQVKSSSSNLSINGSQAVVISPKSGEASISFTISALADNNDYDETAQLEFSANGYSTLRISILIKDSNAQRILVHDAPSSIKEGFSSSFTVKLNTEPASNVTVSLSTSDSTALTVSPSTLNFTKTNYKSGFTVSIYAPEDVDSTSEKSTISLSSTGITTVNQEITSIDNDITPIFTLTSPLSISEGNSVTETISLSGDPGGIVTVNLSSNNTNSLTLSTATLTFDSTNWNIGQNFQYNAIQDANTISETILINASGNTLKNASRTMSTVDDDTNTILLSGITQLTEGGANGNLSISLASDPGMSTVVILSLSSSILEVSKAAFVFNSANYSTPQIFTAVAPAGDGNETAETVIITATGANVLSAAQSVLVIDKDTRVIVSNQTSPWNEGFGGTVEVSLSGDPGIPRTVALTASSLLTFPVIIAFTPGGGGNWNIPQVVSGSSTTDANCRSDIPIVTGSGTGLVSGTYSVTLKDLDIALLNGAIVYLPFNGDSLDESGNGNNGTVTGATLTPNRYGYKDRAYSFNGSGNKITISDTPSLNFGTGEFAIAAWIKTSQTGTWRRIITKRENSAAGNWYSVTLYNNKLRFEIAAGVQFDSNMDVNDNNWHFIAVQRDLISGQYLLFIDNVLDGQMANDGRNLDTSPGIPLEIGTWADTPAEYFNGTIDDIRIYNRALTTTEISNLYNDSCEVRESCKKILDDTLSNGNGAYTINPTGNLTGNPFLAYCDMTTSGGGWTLALKADGNLNTFEYNSSYWTTNNVYPSTVAVPDLNLSEYKSQAFNTLPFSEIWLRMDTSGTLGDMILPITGTSLLNTFNGGFIATSMGRAAWKNMVPNSSLQYNCNKEGVNINNLFILSRIGFVANQENDCNSTDSGIGIGVDRVTFGNPSVGNYASNICACGPFDNGVRFIPSFGYLFVR